MFLNENITAKWNLVDENTKSAVDMPCPICSLSKTGYNIQSYVMIQSFLIRCQDTFPVTFLSLVIECNISVN